MSQRNYLGVQFMADPTILTQQLVVNADGSINVDLVSGSTIIVSGTVSTKPAPLVSAGAGQFGLSVASTGAATSLTVPAGATSAQITVSAANIRYADDGTTPSTSVGMPVYQASSWFYSGPLSALRFYAQSGTATLDVLYYK